LNSLCVSHPRIRRLTFSESVGNYCAVMPRASNLQIPRLASVRTPLRRVRPDGSSTSAVTLSTSGELLADADDEQTFGPRPGDLRSIVGATATATIRRLDALRQTISDSVVSLRTTCEHERISEGLVAGLLGPDRLRHLARDLATALERANDCAPPVFVCRNTPSGAADMATERITALQRAFDDAANDVALSMHELIDCFPADKDEQRGGSAGGGAELPAKPLEASVGDWLRCIAFHKQRHAELTDDLKHKASQLCEMEARHERREEAFRRIKEQLQHDIVQMRLQQGVAADPLGVFSTLDLFLVLSDTATDSQLFQKIQELVGLLSFEETRSAVVENSLLRATNRINNLERAKSEAEHRLKMMAERFAAESSKLKLAVLAAERNNAVLAAEVTAFAKQVDAARATAAHEHQKAAAAEAERDAIELRLIKLKQSQHAEKENLFVRIAELAMKLHTDSKRQGKVWTLEPDEQHVDLAQEIANSRRAPFTDKETLDKLIAVALPPDDPRLVSTLAAQRQRIDTLLQDLELWREAAATAGRQRDALKVNEAELLEDSRRLQVYIASKGLPVPAALHNRERATEAQPEAGDEAGLRQLVRYMRSEGGVCLRRLRTSLEQQRSLVRRVRQDCPVVGVNGALDEVFAVDYDYADDDDGDEANSTESLPGLSRALGAVEKSVAQNRGVVLCLMNEVRRLREIQGTNNRGMFVERDEWVAAWDRLLRSLPPAVAARLTSAGLESLGSKPVTETFARVQAEAETALKEAAEGHRSVVMAQCRDEASRQLSDREAALKSEEERYKREAAAATRQALLQVADLEAKLAKAQVNAAAAAAARPTLTSKESKANLKASDTGSFTKPKGESGSFVKPKAEKQAPARTLAKAPSTNASPAPAAPPPTSVPGVSAVVAGSNVATQYLIDDLRDRTMYSRDRGSQTDFNPRYHPELFAVDSSTQHDRFEGIHSTSIGTAEYSIHYHRASETQTAPAALLQPAITQTDPVRVSSNVATPRLQTAVSTPNPPPQEPVPTAVAPLLPAVVQTVAAAPSTSSADLEAALEEVRLFVTELSNDGLLPPPIHGVRDLRGGAPLPRRLACGSCGQSATLGDWRAVPIASHGCQTDDRQPTGAVAAPPQVASSSSHRLAATSELGVQACMVDEVVREFRESTHPKRFSACSAGDAKMFTDWAVTPPLTPDRGPADYAPPRLHTPTVRPRKPSTAELFASLCDAVVQTVGNLVDDTELDEFRIRIADLQHTIERITARAESAEQRMTGDVPTYEEGERPSHRRKSSAKLPPMRASKAGLRGLAPAQPGQPPPPSFAAREEATQRRRDLSFREQLLARSTSPPHPMFHHSHSKDLHAATSGARNFGTASTPPPPAAPGSYQLLPPLATTPGPTLFSQRRNEFGTITPARGHR
jgi:hypothetical protein